MNKSISNLSKCTSVALALAASSAYAGDLPKSQEVQDTGTLSIANTLDYAPFEFIAEDGTQTGVNVELAVAAADLMGVDLEIVRIPFTAMIPGLAAKRFSVSWETFAPTEDRLKQVDFVTFIQAGIVASTVPDKAAEFEGENYLCGKTVGVNSGTAADFTADTLNEECSAAGLPPIEKAIFPEARDAIQAVLSGRIDARLDDATASGYYEITSEGKMIVVGDIHDVSPLGLAVQKGDAETAEMMRASIQALIDNGTYGEIMVKYGLETSMIPTAKYISNLSDLQD